MQGGTDAHHCMRDYRQASADHEEHLEVIRFLCGADGRKNPSCTQEQDSCTQTAVYLSRKRKKPG